jgi:malate synthase
MTAIEATPHASRPAAVKVPAPAVRLRGRINPEYGEMLTPDANQFLHALSRQFEGRRQALLRARIRRQDALDHGTVPSPSPETQWIRESSWTVAPIPPDLLDRRVEISGPVDRQTVVTALNSMACVYMADFEDGHAPTWDNSLRGQVNLKDAVSGVIGYESPDGQFHSLAKRHAVIMVRPRGWHLVERNYLVHGHPIAASLFDFGVYLYHNARTLLDMGSGPYFYLPKLESAFEARLWNDVFRFAQDVLGIPQGTIRATAVVENILAAFEMDEILYELREHSAGLRFGRWDYLFSIIRKFRNRAAFVLPESCEFNERAGCLDALVNLLVNTCHRRGIHAIGGKTAHNPSECSRREKTDLLSDIMENIRWEAAHGFDGTQVVHATLVPFAKGLFDACIHEAHQIVAPATTLCADPHTLLAIPAGPVSLQALRDNVRITVRYLASWLAGRGTMTYGGRIHNAGSAELARAQVWQWQRHGTALDTGETVTPHLVRRLVAGILEQLGRELSPALAAAERYDQAARIALKLMTGDTFREFLTAEAYPALT